ncbi:16S rRNA (guanine(966)-N(2))-methyltransferase RsmD [Levilactobacillus tujiorum]|uniref:16S rRNA (Guanine(966)-N(2))-methyltransferase RsmD n=1 Tax=Levilactobacillus tujiorum TaxID=2912243 RepID=A0ABX1L7W7_9LACO|nr:16S rRNA (guanine(966)-N(2))-methyltransferase RsmD [Levilactobacillus tujiorum]MCH5465413.1 16S rRNA (guanine(966)-N(2))-methyltransferase RsmD [Levilactobacillus tujiorum]NLR12451.1 16S rRNA (guanine(966)-N(2))-methyltransferase RsmD [Lactobacillus sp. HBUAS51387]NLR30464.1 16S rRNA (guanine(966)-N(2))-methyltransferase RsmD [Levilactobacillus tujiorum]
MRIVAGDFGGRRLKAVPGMATRPTTDKVKEALFNIIGPYFEGGRSLDLFAGSGGLSIEAVSRGIEQAVLIDKQYAAIKTIKDNIAVTKAPERFVVLKRDANRALKELGEQGQSFDLVFFDPPYALQKIADQMAVLRELNLLTDQARIVCETDQQAQLPDELPGFRLLERRDYGITELTIYAVGSDDE